MSEDIVAELRERFPGITRRESLDWPALNCPAHRWGEVAGILRDEFGFDFLTDVTAVDWNEASPRFTAVYHLLSAEKPAYLRVAVDCPDDAEPEVPSVAGLWPTADWHERETFDMFGIRFTGHPDLRRILMWEDYPHFPLRKEFPLAGIETELPDSEVAAETGAGVIGAPMMGGPFVAPQEGPMSEREPRAKDQTWTEKNPKPKS